MKEKMLLPKPIHSEISLLPGGPRDLILESLDIDLIPDTRWVSLAELVTNDVDAAALAALETLAKKLPKALKAAAKRIRQRVHEREE